MRYKMLNVNRVQNPQKNPSIPAGTTKPSEYTNSILENQSTNQEEVKKQSNLDKLLENLC